MRRAAMATVWVVLGLYAAPQASAVPIDGIHNIQHVVVITQENRSFDSYFGTYPGANGIPAGVCLPDPAHKTCARPYHDPKDENVGGPHGTESATLDINGGKMNGFVAVAQSRQKCYPDGADCRACTETQLTKCIDVMG